MDILMLKLTMQLKICLILEIKYRKTNVFLEFYIYYYYFFKINKILM
jgi:hypothetical protein